MVRGLIIRQTFLVLDGILFGLILLTAGLVILHLFQRPQRSAVLNAGADAAVHTDEEPLLADLRARKDYNSITDSGLFGDAGRFDPGPKSVVAPPVVEKVDVEETALKLHLWGVTSLSPKSIYATASIEDENKKDGGKLYFVGAEVVPNVTLEEVYPRWVILKNGLKDPPELERLSMDDKPADDGTTTVASRASSTTRRRPPTKRIKLDKQQLIKDLTLNYAELVTKVKPELYRDASGKVAGITASNISDVPLAQTLGLKDGDILQTVNNEKIDSQQKILEMVQKYQNARSFRIGILRNGKPSSIEFNF